MFVPLVGCRSHRLNLAIEAYIKQHLGNECEMVSKLMTKLSTLKESGRLRLTTSLRPVKRNITRWLGTVNMFDRLERLIPKLQIPSSEVAALMPTAVHLNIIRQHKLALDDFKSITLKLQNRETTLLDSHHLFQSLISEFPNFDFEKYLGEYAKIVHSSAFETGIIKIQNSDQNEMSVVENGF